MIIEFFYQQTGGVKPKIPGADPLDDQNEFCRMPAKLISFESIVDLQRSGGLQVFIRLRQRDPKKINVSFGSFSFLQIRLVRSVRL
ncbi:hypothetical protein BO224_03790 [Erysipelotrichaceae bacterium NYU-BL-E8]|uniref:Uncharacterized protein n=1 Tax=Ileibacterium valens TaxID=1862668 RepID=A0A1U7NCY7_9FIRM|nr:hypothetical protein BO222_11710 [Ileibacterium valens]OLU39033.1 hypothetical protein BM735_08480 [Erysipelotrichaceae bacterium NYU-BL-F16]OLU41202.1 hypothetical protein BO224_03790 [Erysipelotrichaceae bacterium NYU-BL-E8]